MTVLLVGGGTGGHITPLLAVAHELKRIDQATRVVAVTDKYNKFYSLLSDCSDIDEVVKIDGGKLRRYPNESLLKKATDFSTIKKNLYDVVRLGQGIHQARKIIKITKPDVIFIKGGIVGVPVGVAAHQKNVPFITHDSDTKPGLTSRIIARWASLHAVGMPEKFYAYPKNLTRFVGIPVSKEYSAVSSSTKRAAREKLGLPARAKIILVTGGSQGAQQLNEVVLQAKSGLLALKDSYVVHQTGASLSPATAKNYKRVQFINNLYDYSAAADVVIARAGANTIAELAVQRKALIVVPGPYLAGGHQVSNAAHLADANAAIYLKETELKDRPEELVRAVETIITTKTIKDQLEQNLGKLAVPDSAEQIARLILEGIKK
jgi:UDP-N-acetylglucosamine--N-acetylmuramyl-(pentapeptide) pyrophosphoryl-undecaprenol N-acetylglucosamine transferase